MCELQKCEPINYKLDEKKKKKKRNSHTNLKINDIRKKKEDKTTAECGLTQPYYFLEKNT